MFFDLLKVIMGGCGKTDESMGSLTMRVQFSLSLWLNVFVNGDNDVIKNRGWLF